MRHALAFAITGLSTAVACEAPDDAQSSCEGRCDEQAPVSPILGRETPWLQCWVAADDEAGEAPLSEDALVCEMVATNRMLDVDVISLIVTGSSGNVEEVVLHKDGPIQGISLASLAFPLTVQAEIDFDNTDPKYSYSGIGRTYQTSFAVDNKSSLTPNAPFVVTQPFDLWPVHIQVDTRVVSLVVNPYPVPLAPGFAVNGATNIDVRLGTLPARDGEILQFFLPVASTDASAVHGDGMFYRDSRNFVLEGPGLYLADQDGLHAVGVPDVSN